MNKNTSIKEVITYFQPFGKFIFPIAYTNPSHLTISNISSLLPYHSHINADTTLAVLNYMKDKYDKKETIFYDIYSEQEKREDPSKKETGLFFFKGKKNAPFAIVNAGGGFSYVGSIHESFPHALYLSQQGYNAFPCTIGQVMAIWLCKI